MKRSLHWSGIVALILAIALVCSAVAFAADNSSNTGILDSSEIDSIVNTSTDASKVSSPFTEVANAVRSSVVGVNNYETVTGSRYNNYYGFGYGFGRGYGYGNGNDSAATEQLAATGSGVVVSNYGHILTNYHVIEDATRITVTIASSEEEYEATVVCSDESLDLAILHVNDLPLTAVTLGDSDALQVGEWAIVIGNPLGEEFARTVTVGIVSALDREVTDTTYDRYGRKTNVTNTMIQVDAAINSGNSGGGMFNTLGQLMGIPSRKLSSGTTSSTTIDNIGMCIPINVAKPLIRQALESYTGNTVTTASAGTANSSDKPKLGVTVTTLSSSYVRNALPNGAFVTMVSEDSNAEAAGIKAGDLIVEVDGTVISSSTELVQKISEYDAGAQITVKVYRAEGLEEQAADIAKNGLDLTNVGEGEYIDLTVTLLVHSSL